MVVRARVVDTGVVVGGFHRSPEGRVARVFGWSGLTRIVSFAFDDDTGAHKLPEAEFSKWEYLPGLEDFPDARDPILPYEFDLIWDVKTRSGLVRLLGEPEIMAGGASNVREAMARYGLVLTPEEEAIVSEKGSAPTPGW